MSGPAWGAATLRLLTPQVLTRWLRKDLKDPPVDNAAWNATHELHELHEQVQRRKSDLGDRLLTRTPVTLLN